MHDLTTRSCGCPADHSCPGFVEESSRLLKDTLLAVILTEGGSGSNLAVLCRLEAQADSPEYILYKVLA